MEYAERLESTNLQQEVVQPRNVAERFLPDDFQLRRCRRSGPFLNSLNRPVRSARFQDAVHHHAALQKQEDCPENSQRDKSSQHSYTFCGSKRSIGRATPLAANLSANFGRTPVALNRPLTLRFSSRPVCWNTNSSCNVIWSPSMPAISCRLMSFLVPSDNRAI